MKGVISIFSFKKINKHKIRLCAAVVLSAAVIFTCITCFGASNINKGINIANAKQIHDEVTTTSTEIPKTTTTTTSTTTEPTTTTTTTTTSKTTKPKTTTTVKRFNAAAKTTETAMSVTTKTTTVPASTEKTVEAQTTQSVQEYTYDSGAHEFPIYGLTLTDNDLNMMCTIVSSETGYCEDQAQKAVAHTIINRLVSDKFPNDMYSVCTQVNQYTAIHSYFDGQYRAGLAPGSDYWNNSMRLCLEALNEYDFTNGAFAYYNPDICGYNNWFESLNLVYVDQYGRFFNW